MPFKIVETTEKGKIQLFVIPSNWEWKGHLRYPKKRTDYKLARDEHSKPRPEWPVMSCKVKRTALSSYKDAEEELAIMSGHSDTDFCEQEDAATRLPAVFPDYNGMAGDLVYQTQEIEAGMIPISQQETVYTIVDNNGDFLATQSVQSSTNSEIAKKIDLLSESHNSFVEAQTKKMEQLFENQKSIMDLQNKFAQRLASLAVQVDDALAKIVINQNDRAVVSLANSNGIEATAFKIKIIDNVQELEEFERMLSDPAEKRQVMEQYSILCSESNGKGVTFAYKLLDLLFTREFLCRCSWSGGSRGDTIKVALKGYKHMLDFFFRMIHSWDKTYTVQNNEAFFKVVLKNSEQRKKTQNVRASTKRNRSKKQSKESNELQNNGETAMVQNPSNTAVNNKRKRRFSAQI